MEREVITQGTSSASFESKPLEPFYNWKTAANPTTIKGRYIGRFQSKKNPDSHFYVFEREDGTRFAAWECTSLKYKVQDLLDKEKELGLPEGTLFMETTFLGKPQGKRSYAFTKPTIYKVSGTLPANATALPQATTLNTADIPF